MFSALNRKAVRCICVDQLILSTEYAPDDVPTIIVVSPLVTYHIICNIGEKGVQFGFSRRVHKGDQKPPTTTTTITTTITTTTITTTTITTALYAVQQEQKSAEGVS